MSLLILTQYIDSHASSFAFLMPMWLTWSWCSACCFSTSGIIMCLPFMTITSMTARSSLYDQYGLMSRCSWSFVVGQPDIILFLTTVGAHPVSLLVASVIWTYTLGHWSSFVWHLPLYPSLVLAHLCFPCGYDGTANPQ